MDARVDPDDIDLAEAALSAEVRELGLVESDDLMISDGEDHRILVEVGCLDDLGEVFCRLRPLLWVPVEGRVVDSSPALLIARGKGPDRDALRSRGLRQVCQAEAGFGAHLIEHSVAAEAVLVREPLGCGVVTV